MSFCVGMTLLCSGTNCIPPLVPGEPVNPFRDLPPIELNGRAQTLETNIAPLGEMAPGQVLRLKVTGQDIASILVLIEDGDSQEAGVIVGGGPANEEFNYRIKRAGRYFVFVQFSPTVEDRAPIASITVSLGDSSYRPPASQRVLVTFAPGYLTQPGLVDPDSFTDEERQVLVSITDVVRQQVIAQLRRIFDGTPVELYAEEDLPPQPPFSRLTLLPDRVLAETNVEFDAAVPGIDVTSGCLQATIFGEVLPRGSQGDAGDRRLTDEAVVYVGSFQGRGLECRTAALASLNNVVLALAHTAAHEIGHLVGLYHIATVDVMDRRPTAAFQREIGFTRGQLLIEVPVTLPDGSQQLDTRVQTSIIQDPQLYFELNFGE